MKTITAILFTTLCFFGCTPQESLEQLEPTTCTTKGANEAIETINIYLYNEFLGTEMSYCAIASAPVKTRIAFSQYVHFNEYDVCDRNTLYDGNIEIYLVLEPGQQEARDGIGVASNSCTTISLNVLGVPDAPWRDQIINGVKYTLSGRWS